MAFKDKSLTRVETIPLDVNNYRVKYRPRVLSGRAAVDVLESVNTASGRFSTRLDIENDRGTILITPVASDKITSH